MREGEGDGGLTDGHGIGSGGAGLGVLTHVGVQLFQIVPDLIVALELNQRGQNGVGGAGGGGVGHDDLTLELGLQQVFPAGGIFQTLFGKPVGVAGEGDATHIDGVPGAGGIQISIGGLGQVGGLVGFQQALVHSGDIVIGRAAEHQRCLRIVLLSFHTGQHLTGGEADIVDLDAGFLLKLVEIVDDFAFGECGVNGEFLAAGGFGGLLGLGIVSLGSLGLAAAAGGEGQQAGGSQQSGEQALSGFLHKSFLLLIHYLFPFRTAEEKTRLCGNLGQFLFAGNKLRTNS